MARLRLLSLALSLAAASLAACGAPATGDDETSPARLAAAAKEAGTVNGLCPVMKKPVVKDPDLVYEYKGERIGFCCTPCRPKFAKDPEKFLSAMRADPERFGYHR